MADDDFPTEYRFNGRTYKPHPCADCFPLMTGSAFRDLVDDLRHNGMTQPVLVLGDYILDGRNRLLAAFEAGLEVIPVKELPHNIDAVALVASLNVHRRQLTSTQRAKTCGDLLDLSQRAFRANNPDAPDPADFDDDPELDPLDESNDETVAPDGASLGGSAGGNGGAAASPSSSASPRASMPALEQTDPVAAGSADATGDSSGSAGEQLDPGVLDQFRGHDGQISRPLLAKGFGVSASSVARSQAVHARAPELGPSIRGGVITLADAERILFEPEDVRLQAVADVRAGEATTAVRAIRQRYQREPAPDPDAPPSPADAQPPAVSTDMPSGELGVPSALLGFVRTLLGEITLDPCSAPWCGDHVGVGDWYGADRDGLLQDWSGRVWVFPPPDRAEPFLVKLLAEFDAEHVEAAAVLVPMTPWADATLAALGSPFFRALAVPRNPLSCRRPDGSVVCPPDPLWLLLFGALTAPPTDVLGAFAATVLIPQVGSSHA